MEVVIATTTEHFALICLGLKPLIYKKRGNGLRWHTPGTQLAWGYMALP